MKQVSEPTFSFEPFTRRMFTRIITALSRTLSEEELSVPQVATLYLLDEHGSRRMSDIAAELGRTAPATSRMIDDLVSRKLVKRDEDPADRRGKLLTLTPHGQTFILRAGEARMRTIAETLPTLPKQALTELLKVITKLTH